MNSATLAYRLRTELGMTTSEAAQYACVSKRTWELWEAGALPMPDNVQELLRLKLDGMRPEKREVVMVLSEDGMTPIDAVASDTFCGLVQTTIGVYVISSLAVQRETNRPFVHRVTFHAGPNAHVIRAASKWANVLDQ